MALHGRMRAMQGQIENQRAGRLKLGAFRGWNAGEPILILGNGPSLLTYDLGQWRGLSLGTNRSHRVHQSTYHMALEQKYEAGLMKLKCPVFVAGTGWRVGYECPILSATVTTFSRDMEHGVVIGKGTVGSVVFAAIQLAAYMGASPIYLVGVDLAGPHFDGTPASKHLTRQNELFALVPKDVEVYAVPPSLSVFPKKEWSEVIACQ